MFLSFFFLKVTLMSLIHLSPGNSDVLTKHEPSTEQDADSADPDLCISIDL